MQDQPLHYSQDMFELAVALVIKNPHCVSGRIIMKYSIMVKKPPHARIADAYLGHAGTASRAIIDTSYRRTQL
jgi:hypothetical protein